MLTIPNRLPTEHTSVAFGLPSIGMSVAAFCCNSGDSFDEMETITARAGIASARKGSTRDLNVHVSDLPTLETSYDWTDNTKHMNHSNLTVFSGR